ncbi:hypothetical protein J4G53_25370 [Serratia ureilytica]|uniref:hypothetical protein n=1 Tax=Serratia ureilytica TaxID=300181 RepID=UPI001AA11A89|nr:hypothetical protein [Serratia ureilytica]MBO1811563.1 hypothetical protein [Serratia ureilytica]
MKRLSGLRMKNDHETSLRDFIRIAALSLLPVALPSAAIDAGTVTIKGNVVAICDVSMPATITMPDITYVPAMNDGNNVGNAIPGVSGANIPITGKCSGDAKFRYVLSASDYEGSCIAPSPKGIVQLCLSAGSQKLDFSGGKQPVITGLSGGELKLSITPAFGSQPKAEAYSAVLSVKIEPL